MRTKTRNSLLRTLSSGILSMSNTRKHSSFFRVKIKYRLILPFLLFFVSYGVFCAFATRETIGGDRQVPMRLVAHNIISTWPVVFLAAIVIIIYQRLRPISYMVCPNCFKSVKVIENWTCDHCRNRQKKSHYITDKCHHCNRDLSTIFCEHCHKEIYL